ncbi:zinc finger protein ZFP2-like [Armigeres subalbatus]|uniref:zinc finger protein ZFP2-like n=1 Tax=Armigeres subalbatus TaxID=124917 RepID=UPI002ED49642
MDAGMLLVPKLKSLPGPSSVGNSAMGGPLSKMKIVAKGVNLLNQEDSRGKLAGCNGNKQKQRPNRDGDLILVMEPQNPSPTKYFDQNGVPLKKESVEDGELLKELPIGKSSSSKKRSKLTITCHKCSRLFETKIEFEFHYRKSYNQEPIYCCTTCDKQISQYKAYRLHIYRHLNSANQRYTCGTCAKVFHQKSDLNRHENVHESHNQAAILAEAAVSTKPHLSVTSEEKISCDRCTAVFGSQAEVRVHVKKIHPIPKQMIECPDCGKFLSAGSLYSHRKIHSDGPKFTCEDCDKSFVQKINFIHHRKKHLPNDERPFPCGECGKAFFEKSHLQRHQFFHSEERPYKCGLCGKCYKTERCLKVHSAVHNADRPFVCTECNKGFLSSSKLRQHSNIHSGLRPFKCKYCTRDFTNFPNWLKHIRRRHKVDHRTGEKLDSVPKFMTKKKDKPTEKPEAMLEKQDSIHPLKETPQLSIKEESLPFVGENSNIDLNLVSKDDLLQPLKMEEMEDIFLELPGVTISKIVADDEDAQHAVERPRGVATSTSTASEPLTEEDESEPLRPTDSDLVDPPPLGMSEDDNELFQFGYVQPEFDCDFSIKNEFSLRAEAVNMIREIDSANMSDTYGASSAPSAVLPAATGALVYDINGELPIFPTLISICGDEQQFRLINPNFIHLPQLRRGSGSGSSSGTPGNSAPSGSGLKMESP